MNIFKNLFRKGLRIYFGREWNKTMWKYDYGVHTKCSICNTKTFYRVEINVPDDVLEKELSLLRNTAVLRHKERHDEMWKKRSKSSAMDVANRIGL